MRLPAADAVRAMWQLLVSRWLGGAGARGAWPYCPSGASASDARSSSRGVGMYASRACTLPWGRFAGSPPAPHLLTGRPRRAISDSANCDVTNLPGVNAPSAISDIVSVHRVRAHENKRRLSLLHQALVSTCVSVNVGLSLLYQG